MLNLNYNIIGAFGKSNIGAGPDIQPTTTTTTTTTSTTTTSTTTTTVGPASLRTDPFSASLVYAVPGAYFDSQFGQQSFRSDISSYIRGTGTSFTDAELPLSSSKVPNFGTGSFEATSATVKWAGYPSSIEISGSNGSGSLTIVGSATASQFEFPTENFTIETWINYQNPATGGFTPGAPGPSNINATIYRQYGFPNVGFGFTGNGIGYQNPGNRFLIQTAGGSEIYIDSPQQNRAADTWYHIASQRSGSLFSTLWNGNVVSSFTYSGAIGTGSLNDIIWIMGLGEVAVKCHRYQDYRIYKGAAKYSGATSGSSYTLPDSIVII